MVNIRNSCAFVFIQMCICFCNAELASTSSKYPRGQDYVVDTEFSYDPLSPRGPDRWTDFYPSCGGSSQSPIDINPTHCYPSPVTPIILLNANVAPESVEIINERYTVKFLLNWRTTTIIGRPLVHGEELGSDNYFIPREVHFHWGHGSDRGSEHLIDGQQFALEMHIVNFNTRYGSVANATNQPDGILVISQLFRATKMAKKLFFADFIEQVREAESEIIMKTQLCKFAFDELIRIPAEEWNYVIYQGSFTTPPCHEPVTWLVFLSVQNVAESQLKHLRQLHGLERKIGDNFRPIQNRNNTGVCFVNWD